MEVARTELEPREIMADIDAYILDTEGRKPNKQSSNWMSSIGHPCARYLFYLRHDGDRRAQMPIAVLRKLKAGREHERRAKQIVMSAGYNWIQDQSPVAMADLELFGKHDGKVRKGRSRAYLSEVKSVTSNLFMKIKNNPSYVLTSKFFTQAIAQFNAYLVGLNEGSGFFFFVNREDEDIHIQEYIVDWELWEKTKQKLRKVNMALKKEDPPDRLDTIEKEDRCPICPFNHICLPDYISGGGIKFLDEAEVVLKLERMDELKPLIDEYNDLKDWVKFRFKGVDGVVAGDYLIEGKQIEYERKATEAVKVSFWKSSITKINSQ